MTNTSTGRGMAKYGAIAVALAVMAIPVAASAQQASSRGMSGNMNLMRLVNRIKTLERTTSILSEQNQHLLTCQGKLMAYAPSSEQADGDGCAGASSDMQAGSIIDTTGHSSRTRTVVFKKPFDTPPKVLVAMQGYTFSGPCRSDYFHFEPEATNITRTGFTIVLQGKSSGCAKSGVEGIVWLAAPDLTTTVVASAPPVSKPPSGGSGGTSVTGGVCSGGGDTDCTRHPYANDPSDPASWNGGTGLGAASTRSR